MSFARLLETGSGRLAARLAIEGLEVEFVSDPALERSAPSLASTLAKLSDGLNLLPAPGAVTWGPDGGAPATCTPGQSDPAGGTDAWLITDSDPAATSNAHPASVAITGGNTLILSAFVEQDPSATHTARLGFDFDTGTDAAFALRLDTGAASPVPGSGAFDDIQAIDLGSHWLVVATCTSPGAASTVRPRLYPAWGTPAGFPANDPTATGSVTVYGPRIADATADPEGADPLGDVATVRDRIYCMNLSDAGLMIDESVNIPDAALEAQGSSIRLFETEDERLAQVLCWAPDIERRVTQTLGPLASDATVDMRTTDGIETGKIYHLGTEALQVASKSPTSLTVARGMLGTIRQKHWVNTGTVQERVLTNRPLRVRGRRAYLYLYGEGDDPTGDGTLVALYHVASEPACDDAGTTWRMQLASIAERLKGKVGGGFEEEGEISGAYYPGQAPLYIRIDSTWDDGSGSVGGNLDIYFAGYGETQQDFCDALNAELALQIPASHAHTYQAVVTPDGQSWQLEVTLTETLVSLTIDIKSQQDGELRGEIHAIGSVGSVRGMLDATGERVSTAAIGDRVYMPRGGPIPRGHFGLSKDPPYAYPSRFDPTPNRPSWDVVYSDTRIYIRVADDCDAVQINWPGGEAREYSILGRNDTEGFIRLDSNDTGAGYYGTTTAKPIGATYAGSDVPEIKQIRSISAPGSTIADLRDGLVANGAEYCNLTGQPFLSDADLADWSAVVAEAARGRHWLLSRQYTIASAVDLEELLQAEMRLYGLFPVIESDGRIGVRSIDVATSGGDPVDIDEEMVSVGWSSMERGGQTVNRVVLKTGYDPNEDEWLGGEIIVENMDSYAQDHEDRSLEIEPRSRATGGDETIDPVDAADVIRRVTDLFGFPHDFITVRVPWTRFGLRLGDPVLFSAHHLPDYRTGKRPTTRVRGIVVARRWQIGEPYGQLRLLVHGLNVAGYAPTARITQVKWVSPNWKLELDPSMYVQSGADIYGYWTVGDLVRVIKVDSESPADIIDATVTEVSPGNHVSIQTFGTWVPGSATWELGLCSYVGATDEQRRYAYIAGTDGLLDGDNPRVYAP